MSRYDGRMAAPVIGGESAIKPNLVTGPGKPGVVVYAMPHDKLESWRSLAGANAKSERVTYADDGGVVVEIWYRVRYPSGKRTATLKVVFTSDDQSINRITIP
ncbi:MAG: hypothetical protein NTV51_30225 [Verrucomicrobia bacterium]|nr:hypothetical protein [Verrucomicrobiota bacterium]